VNFYAKGNYSMRLEEKTAIVTGGAGGIGEAVCLAFAEEGADVVVADIIEDKARQVCDAITSMGRKSIPAALDVTSKSQVDAMVDRVLAEFGKIDILVNAAGILMGGAIEDVAEQDWDRVMAVNLKGTFLCSQAVGKKMIARRKGSIVNLASVAGHMPQVGLNAYSPSKAGVLMLTKIMAVEWAAHGVRVNAVSPGPTETAMALSVYDTEQKLNRRKKAIPMNRFASPDEIAKAVLYLGSDESGFVTGDSLVIDGGSLNSMFHLVGLMPDAG